VRVNLEQLERYLAAGSALCRGRPAPPPTDGLLALRGVIEAARARRTRGPRPSRPPWPPPSPQALDGLKAREEEGAALTAVLTGLVDRIEELVRQAAEPRPPASRPCIKERFERRMTELAARRVSEERIVQEAAAMAVKADVREELDRLAGHVDAARALLGGDGAAGRRLDFLTQEFMREANTLCSKSALPALDRARPGPQSHHRAVPRAGAECRMSPRPAAG
jgi:uncharacterized protein YicC (UPF0701 family)